MTSSDHDTESQEVNGGKDLKRRKLAALGSAVVVCLRHLLLRSALCIRGKSKRHVQVS
jgi:hypothetical protein